jgi:hypothetical protein
MEVAAGMRLKSAVSSTEVVVVRPPSEPVALTCAGVPLVAFDEPIPDGVGAPEAEGQSLLGKRYADEASGLEVLCTRGGPGLLACDGRMLLVQKTKPLPSSD